MNAPRMVERQMSYKKKDQPEVALILDDILGSLKSGSRVNTLSARFRHYNIKLLLFSTQVFRYVRRTCHQPVLGASIRNISGSFRVLAYFAQH